MNDALKVENLSFAYPNGKRVLEDVSFSVGRGEFVLIAGPTGCGKTTLLRHARPEITPFGTRGGKIEYTLPTSFVSQNPENQIVMDTVFEELAFALENKGIKPAVIRRRVAEISAFFGLEELMDARTSELSGGEKQLLSLAGAAATQPGLMVLDEPTAMLDPVATHTFWEMLGRLNRELGMAVLVTEHRLDEVLSLCDRALLLDDGRILSDLHPEDFASDLLARGLFEMLPEPAKLAAHLGIKTGLPLTVRKAREMLSDKKIVSTAKEEPLKKNEVILKARDVWFTYKKGEHFALLGADFDLKRGEIHALVGGNGSGKSTLLKLLSGLMRPMKGKIKVRGRTALLVQDPKAMFWHDELGKDFMELAQKYGKSYELAISMLDRFGLRDFEKRHPYDLSGGEMQKAAIAKLLFTDADILLLDEPTKGIDAPQKSKLKKLLADLVSGGKSIVLVTHDLDFVASCASRCTMLSFGRTVCTEGTRDFFKGNIFYTTDVNRILKDCVVWEEARCEKV